MVLITYWQKWVKVKQSIRINETANAILSHLKTQLHEHLSISIALEKKAQEYNNG